jgi:hypothetical protein
VPGDIGLSTSFSFKMNLAGSFNTEKSNFYCYVIRSIVAKNILYSKKFKINPFIFDRGDGVLNDIITDI